MKLSRKMLRGIIRDELSSVISGQRIDEGFGDTLDFASLFGKLTKDAIVDAVVRTGLGLANDVRARGGFKKTGDISKTAKTIVDVATSAGYSTIDTVISLIDLLATRVGNYSKEIKNIVEKRGGFVNGMQLDEMSLWIAKYLTAHAPDAWVPITDGSEFDAEAKRLSSSIRRAVSNAGVTIA